MGVTGLMDAENLILCPTFPENQFYAVTFFTSELGDDAELSDFARSENQTPLELEPATGLSVEEFYNLYQQDDEVVCLKSPRELWK
jgi:hypothetical protein